MMNIHKIGVFTSGGDSPGMNAAIRSVVRTATYYGLPVYGIRRGYQGMIEGEISQMFANSVSNIIQTGGTILKTARSDAFRTLDGRKKAYENLKKFGIDGIVAIGGDGTYAGAEIFSADFPDIRIVGIPGTIDNDLSGTDFTIGFDTAINTAMRAIDNIRDTADSLNRLFFVEVMGRDKGFIAAHVGIGSGSEAFLIPEEKTNLEALIDTLDTGWRRQKTSSIIIVAEGDDAGGAFEVAAKVKEKFAYYDTKVSVLGHLQRGGSPTCQDRVLASILGSAAVDELMKGNGGVAIGQIHQTIVTTPFNRIRDTEQHINPLLIRLVDVLSV